MNRFTLHRPSRKGVFVVAAILAIVAGIPALAAAVGPGSHPRPTGPTVAATGQSNGGDCRIGFDTDTNVLTPPDDSTGDNVAASTIQLTKQCAGAVIGEFVSEINTPAAGDFIHVDMRATCLATGGFASPCTVGQQAFGQPGHAFLTNQVVAGTATRSMAMVWTALPRGIWRFEVLPGGDGTASLEFRTFTVEAVNGG